jgi:hypothetical protein
MTLEPIGGIATVSLTEQEAKLADPSRAQMLARVGHPTATVESESKVSASVAQANTRRQQETR